LGFIVFVITYAFCVVKGSDVCLVQRLFTASLGLFRADGGFQGLRGRSSFLIIEKKKKKKISSVV
jgi:hypothetical protein